MANTASVCKQTEMDCTYDMESISCKNTEYIHVYYYWKQTFERQSRKLNTLNHQMVHLQKIMKFFENKQTGMKSE